MTPKSEPPSSQPSTTTPSNVSLASSLVHTVWDFIRPQPWVINNIRQRKSQKILFRSWLAGWAALIFMLPTQSLQTIGNLCVEFVFLTYNPLHSSCRYSCSAYFGILFSMFIPPFCPVHIYVVVRANSQDTAPVYSILPELRLSSNLWSEY
jgi:hypothetical protein